MFGLLWPLWNFCKTYLPPYILGGRAYVLCILGGGTHSQVYFHIYTIVLPFTKKNNYGVELKCPMCTLLTPHFDRLESIGVLW